MAIPGPSSVWQSRIDFLKRRRGALVWSTFALLALAEAFVVGLPNLYRASATLLVERQGTEPLVESGAAEEAGSRLQAIKQVALSRSRLTALIEKFGLYGADHGVPVTEDTLARLQRDIRVDLTNGETSTGRTTTIAFTLSYVGTDPQTSADVTNALASFFVAQNDQMRTQQASYATQLIKEQVDAARAQLDAQEARVSGYTAKNIGALPQQVDANLAAVSRLDAQLRVDGEQQLTLLARRQTLQNQLAEFDNRRVPVDDQSLTAKLEGLKKDLADMQATESDSYPDVKATKAQIKQLEAQIAAGVDRTAQANASSERASLQAALTETDDQIKRLNQETQNLRAEVSTYEKRVESAPSHEPAVQGLMRDFQAARDRYDALIKRYDDAQMNERAERSQSAEEFRVIDPAIPPTSPTGPARSALVALGVLFALAAALLVAIVADLLDTSFHTLDDLRAFTKVPVLASIPEIPTRRGRVGRGARVAALAFARVAAVSALAIGMFHLARMSDQVVRVLSRVG